MPSSILIVENSSELARQVVYNLQQNGYNVFHANQGMKSLELHEAYCPDLVILDWTLPGLNGEEVLTWLRQLCAPRVLMLTEHGSPGGLAGQADATLDKPFTLDHLLQKVGEMLARPGGLRAENLLICGPLELEPGAYRAVLHGQPLNLARAEFDLLNLMVSHPGRIFSRSYLEGKIWEGRSRPGDRSVDNLVLRLRKKLGPFGRQIEAVWGQGYRLLALEKGQETAP